MYEILIGSLGFIAFVVILFSVFILTKRRKRRHISIGPTNRRKISSR